MKYIILATLGLGSFLGCKTNNTSALENVLVVGTSGRIILFKQDQNRILIQECALKSLEKIKTTGTCGIRAGSTKSRPSVNKFRTHLMMALDTGSGNFISDIDTLTLAELSGGLTPQLRAKIEAYDNEWTELLANKRKASDRIAKLAAYLDPRDTELTKLRQDLEKTKDSLKGLDQKTLQAIEDIDHLAEVLINRILDPSKTWVITPR